MMKVGVTGGIGSGKSLVCKIFELLGVPVYYADERAKALYQKDEVRAQVEKLFGPSIYWPDGTPNKAVIAEKVFANRDLLKALNNIIHPAVDEDFKLWIARNAHAPYTVKEAAILMESGAYKEMDEIICVEAPLAIRLERVIQRDSASKEQVQSRMQQQMTDAERAKFCHHRILNDGFTPLLPQVLALHQHLLNKSGT